MFRLFLLPIIVTTLEMICILFFFLQILEIPFLSNNNNNKNNNIFISIRILE